MDEVPALPPFAAVVVAAGAGLRAGQELPKQFASWRGKPLVRHSVERFVASGAQPVIVVIPDQALELAQAALAGIPGVVYAIGGPTRQQSVMRGLLTLAGPDIERVLIHDAARPNVPYEVVERLLQALDTHSGAIPVLPVVDSLAIAQDGLMAGTADREIMRRVQTPQAFRYEAIIAAHEAWPGNPDAGDDAQVLRAAEGDVALVEGDERLKKVTFAEDFVEQIPPIRTGTGFDVHRLAAGEELWLCGVKIPHYKGLAGHSDADVALHAVVDALLGAIAAEDIGSHFPPADPRWKGASSDNFVNHAAKLVADAGYAIGNVDLTIICEAPKIGPHRAAMRARLAQLLGTALSCVSVKATTTERLGFTGRGEGIAAQAVVTLMRSGAD